MKSALIRYKGDSRFEQHSDIIHNIPENDEFANYDSAYYGRCTILTLSEKRIKQGIKSIKLYLFRPANILMHTPGMFLTYPERAKNYMGRQVRLELPDEVKLGSSYTWKVKHEVHELVELNGNGCINQKQYSKDQCVDKIIQRESLEKVGCTTPFEIDKSRICANVSNAIKALKIYDEGMNMWRWNGSDILPSECLIPCSIFTFSTEAINSKKVIFNNPESPHAMVEIKFEDLIKVTTEYYTYTAVSLIAEIGGYVGLFLGISVNQIINLIDILVEKFQQIGEHLKK